MTMRQVVQQLEASGLKVKYTIRKDGGIRITKINGTSYRGSTGNAAARQLVGTRLSERRKSQLESIRTKKGRFGNPKKAEIPKETKKQIQKIQRRFKRNAERGGRRVTITIRQYRKDVEKYGVEEANRRLRNIGLYARGIAYPENVDTMIQRLQEDLAKVKNANERAYIIKIIELLRANRENIPEKEFGEFYSYIYEWERGLASAGTLLQHLRKIIKA